MIIYMERLRYFIIKNKYTLFILAVVLLVLFFYAAYGTDAAKQNISSLYTDNAKTEGNSEAFFIEVVGQVQKPGVYAIKSPLIVIQAIELAGGLTENADLEYVHRIIPLSAKVKPEQKIFIPALGSSTTLSNQINLNTSSQSVLMDISGVGEVTANKIIAIRPISSWEQVQQIANLSSSTFAEIKKQAVL